MVQKLWANRHAMPDRVENAVPASSTPRAILRESRCPRARLETRYATWKVMKMIVISPAPICSRPVVTLRENRQKKTRKSIRAGQK